MVFFRREGGWFTSLIASSTNSRKDVAILISGECENSLELVVLRMSELDDEFDAVVSSRFSAALACLFWTSCWAKKGSASYIHFW